MKETTVEPGVSTAPDGTGYRIPGPAALAAQWAEVRAEAEQFRAAGGRIVVVQGLGFVGAAVAAVIAGARDGAGKPRYYVVGTDLATAGGYWKVAKINAGLEPIASPDPVLKKLIEQGVHEAGNLRATTSEEAYGLADVIVVDLPLDVADRFVREAREVDIRLEPFERAVRAIGRHMKAEALVVVETTVPIGVCEKVALPVLRAEREARGITSAPLLAHAYERVMPGPGYSDSIRNYWRTFSGVDEASRRAAREFLDSFIDTARFPLWELDDPSASEMAKLLENSYRAVNIAFIQEWTLLAERIGVNLYEVIESIRVRKGTHDNMRLPGFGVGGYCLTKDPLLAQWSATQLYGTDVVLAMTVEALRINQEMPLHTFRLVEELAGGAMQGRRIGVCGVSYLPEVPDTRNTPVETLVDALAGVGASVRVHDPYLAAWEGRPDAGFTQELDEMLGWAEGLVLAIPHRSYRERRAADWLRHAGCRFLVDAQNGIPDATAEALHGGGWRVAGVGKGHWRRLGYDRTG